jgi:dTDP-4-amino-4,6-dideoxygalactose transaminase
MIPFSPPFIDQETIEDVVQTLRSGWITTGPQVKKLEQLVSGLAGDTHCLAANSATSALMLTLHWYGISRGDEVIIPAYTYCATALAVMHLGATPVMVDIIADGTIDASAVREAITSKTKAIIPVDVAGWPCDYDALKQMICADDILQIFSAKGSIQEQLGRILLISDAAHSLGAVYKNSPAGKLADITVFSLHAVKNATTAEGGVIALNLPNPFNNQEVYQTMRLWTLNGQTKDAYQKSTIGGWRYDIVYPGFKLNMPDVLAAVGLSQLRQYRSKLLPARQEIFETYDNMLKAYDWAMTPVWRTMSAQSSCHVYALRVKGATEQQRDQIIQSISEKGVAVNVHFVPLPMLTVFRQSGWQIESFPKSYEIYANEISLPVYPGLTFEQVKQVTEAVVYAVNRVLICR